MQESHAGDNSAAGAPDDLWKKILDGVAADTAARRSKAAARAVSQPRQAAGGEVDLLKRVLAALENRGAADTTAILKQILNAVEATPRELGKPLAASQQAMTQQIEALRQQLAAQPAPPDLSQPLAASQRAITEQLEALRQQLAAQPAPPDLSQPLAASQRAIAEQVQSLRGEVAARANVEQLVSKLGQLEESITAMRSRDPSPALAQLTDQLDQLRKGSEVAAARLDQLAAPLASHQAALEPLAASQQTIADNVHELRQQISAVIAAQGESPARWQELAEQIAAQVRGHLGSPSQPLDENRLREVVQSAFSAPAPAPTLEQIATLLQDRLAAAAPDNSALDALPDRLGERLTLLRASLNDDTQAAVSVLRDEVLAKAAALQEQAGRQLQPLAASQQSIADCLADLRTQLTALAAGQSQWPQLAQSVIQQVAQQVSEQIKNQPAPLDEARLRQIISATAPPDLSQPLAASQQTIADHITELRTQVSALAAAQSQWPPLLEKVTQGIGEQLRSQPAPLDEARLRQIISEAVPPDLSQSFAASQQSLADHVAELGARLSALSAAQPQWPQLADGITQQVTEQVTQQVSEQLKSQPVPLDESRLRQIVAETAAPRDVAQPLAASQQAMAQTIEELRGQLTTLAAAQSQWPGRIEQMAGQLADQLAGLLAEQAKAQPRPVDEAKLLAATRDGQAAMLTQVKAELGVLAGAMQQMRRAVEEAAARADAAADAARGSSDAARAAAASAMAAASQGAAPAAASAGSAHVRPATASRDYGGWAQRLAGNRAAVVALGGIAVLVVGMFIVLIINTLAGNRTKENFDPNAAGNNPALASATGQGGPGDNAGQPAQPPSPPAKPSPATAPNDSRVGGNSSTTAATQPPPVDSNPAPSPTPANPAASIATVVKNLTDLPPDALPAAPRELADAKQVVFLIHVAGESYEVITPMLAELKQRIGDLKESQQFTVIFSSGKRPVEAPPEGFKPGANADRRRIETWVDLNVRTGSIRPAVNPFVAVDLAFSYKPDLIWIITDGLAGTAPDQAASADLLSRIETLNPKAAIRVCGTQVTRPDAGDTLKKLTERYGGSYQVVGDKVSRQ